mmetsp:Transcript_55594/g.159921  ORF Transcript_55594/g.159921 Transcript_55594/m.159921 type:complete len:246 (-) Transcript_55594:569-1306(-)
MPQGIRVAGSRTCRHRAAEPANGNCHWRHAVSCKAERLGSGSHVHVVLLARIPVQAAPHVVLEVQLVRQHLDRWLGVHARGAEVVVADVAEGQAGRQSRTLGPRKVRYEACRFPMPDHFWLVLGGALDMLPEERQLPALQIQTHGALKALARRDRGQRLDVGALDLPRRLPDLPLSDHGPGVRAEGDAAAAAGLEVNDGKADVVRVGVHLHFQIDAGRRVGREQVRAELVAAIRNLVGLLNRRDF